MRSAAALLAVLCLVAAVYALPAPIEKDALEPQDDLKTDSSYGLGYAYPSLGYYGGYGLPAYGYGYGYGLYGYGYPRYYYGYGYPSYYL